MITARRASLVSAACLAAALTVMTPGSAGARFSPDSVTIDKAGRIAPDGTLTLTGTYRCSGAKSGPVVIGAKVVQGEAQVGTGGTTAVCDGEEHAWTNTGGFGRYLTLTPGAATGEATLIVLERTSGLPPVLPYVLVADRQDLTLRQG
ncbi:DUF6299 family protein [Streptomyces sp. NPDC051907]|uniref:DUF6299 family protein n=1 Tax=Streptomyces sp. NPDC051907 TaxID=3155284 RepID=UPI0034370A8A